MNCPKCNAELKPGARFCHVCGFDTQTVETPAPETIVNPNPVEQNVNSVHLEGFTMVKPSSTTLIPGIIAIIGALGVFLPWIRVSFWGTSISASGYESWQGIIIILLLVVSALFGLIGNAMKLDPKAKGIIMGIGGIISAILTFTIFFDIISTPMVNLGFGIFITLFASIAVIVLGFMSISKTEQAVGNINNQATSTNGLQSSQKKSTMAIICFFLGGLGIHRFMMGYTGIGILMLLTGGLLGILTLVDFIRILTGDLKMADGSQLS